MYACLIVHRFRTITGNTPLQAPLDISYEELLGFTDGMRNTASDRKTSKKEPQQPRRKPKHPWSAEEDEGLVKGYQQYGFCWKDIANDQSLPLGDRSGPQIRDRFRKRFPELYGEAPVPGKEPSNDTGTGTSPAGMPKSRSVRQLVAAQNQLVGCEDKKSIGGGAQSRTTIALPKQISSAFAPHDINGLLNSEEEEIRQSSFRDEDWDQNVTLAPLQWEDLCAKPMFELD